MAPSKSNEESVVVDSAVEIRETANNAKEGKAVLCITFEMPKVIINDFVQKYSNEPGKLTCRNGVVDGFSIKGAMVRGALPGDIVGDQPDDHKKWCQGR